VILQGNNMKTFLTTLIVGCILCSVSYSGEISLSGSGTMALNGSGAIEISTADAGGTEWLDTFEGVGAIKTWEYINSNPDYQATAIIGTDSLEVYHATLASYAITTDFSPTNTLEFSYAYQYSADPATNQDTLEIRDTTDTVVFTITFKSSERISLIDGAGTTVLGAGDLGPTGVNSGYFDINITYYFRFKLVQSASAGADEMYSWVSTDGTAWTPGPTSTVHDWDTANQFADVTLRNSWPGASRTLYDNFKLTIDGSATSDF